VFNGFFFKYFFYAGSAGKYALRGIRGRGTAEEFFSGKNPAVCSANPRIFALACAKNFQVYPARGCHCAHIFIRNQIVRKVKKNKYTLTVFVRIYIAAHWNRNDMPLISC